MKKIVVFCFALALAGCSIEYAYEVTGDSDRADISYIDSGGSVVQVVGSPLPWKKTFRGYSGDVVSLLAQNGGSGEITASIYKSGAVFRKEASHGAFAVVSVGGTL